jgi:hypothetical protein
VQAFLIELLKHASDPGRLMVFASPTFANVVSGWLEGKWVPNVQEAFYGATVDGFMLGVGGKIPMTVQQNWFDDELGFGGFAFVVNTDNIKRKVLSDTVMKLDVVQKGQDYTADKIQTDQGFIVNVEQSHGFIYGVTS